MNKILITIVLTLSIILAVYFYKSPAEKVAYEHVAANSVVNFKLEKVFEDERFAKYYVFPIENGNDQAQIYLINNNGQWEVIAFGTAFDDLEGRYPELKNR